MLLSSLCVVLMFVGSAQDDATRPDPIGAIRAMVDRGDYADAMEALAGLPESAREREEVYLRFKMYDLPGARALGEKQVARESTDVEVWRILGDVAAMERRFDVAVKCYGKATFAIPKDARLNDAGKDAELGAMQARDVYVRRELEYQGRVQEARGRLETAVWVCLGALGVVVLGSFFVGIRVRER